MNKIRLSLSIFLVLLQIFLISGCWNYREIDEMAIVAGVAIDRGKEKTYEITVEVVKIGGEKGASPKSQTQSTEGDTIFDAVRNQIAISGKKLYWSHAKVVIVSQEVASDNLLGVIDWYNRDSETRDDLDILISREKTAKEILESKGEEEEIKSFMMEEMLVNTKNFPKAPMTQIWEVISNLSIEGISNVVPTVTLEKAQDGKKIKVQGSALFKKGKMIGYLDDKETMYLLFVKGDIKGGAITQKIEQENAKASLSLEIFNSSTKLKPKISEDKIEMLIKIDMTLAIDEIEGNVQLDDEKTIEMIEKNVEAELKNKIEALVKRVQAEYNSDIFGFGSIIHGDNPKEWKKISKEWDQRFPQLQVTVSSKVNIKNSAMMAKSIKIKE